MNQSQEDQFLVYYEELSDAIFRHCYFRLYNREEARDLTQEAFIKTWQYLAGGKEVENLKAFIYRVANNLVIDYVRKKKSLSLDELHEAGFDPKGEDQVKAQHAAEIRELAQHLEQLPDEYREAVTMRYFNDLMPREIAEITGESENVISVRITRGVQKLREQVQHER
jgi:RNA polymerase sigma-70 factor (ECF subfamily)